MQQNSKQREGGQPESKQIPPKRPKLITICCYTEACRNLARVKGSQRSYICLHYLLGETERGQNEGTKELCY